VSEVTSEAVQGNLRNIALFIDYENVYKSLLPNCRNVIRDGFFEKVRKWCSNHGGRIVKIAVYCNFDNPDLHESFHQSLLQSYGIESVHTSNQGKNYADIQITIDVLNSMYLNSNIDEFMIMSNDKDMTPLLNTIRLNKRRATVITIGNMFNNSICMFADDHLDYDVIISSVTDIPLIVESIEQSIWENTSSYLTSKCTEWLSRSEVPVYGVEGFLSNQISHHKIMRYELANILRNFALKDLVVFHKYIFKGSSYIGFIPASNKCAFTAANIIKPEMLIDNYDLDGIVSREYQKYSH